MNISYLKNKNIHFVECKDWHDVYGYEKSEMKEDIINYIEQLQQQNKKYKEVIEKIRKHCEIEINASNHYLENHSSQKELCHKVAHQRILDILKESGE